MKKERIGLIGTTIMRINASQEIIDLRSSPHLELIEEESFIIRKLSMRLLNKKTVDVICPPIIYIALCSYAKIKKKIQLVFYRNGKLYEPNPFLT